MRTRPGLAVFTLALLTLGAQAAAAPSDTRSGVTDAPAEVGYLILTCEPPANVTIDGQAKGPSPIVNLALPVGPHKVTLVSLDGTLKRTLGFKIVKGEKTTLRVNLGP